MFDVVTGGKVSVEPDEADGSYIIVPPQQVAALCRLLEGHRIPHALEGAVPSRPHADSPSEPVIRLGLAVEVTYVQDILDSAP